MNQTMLVRFGPLLDMLDPVLHVAAVAFLVLFAVEAVILVGNLAGLERKPPAGS
jgi:hypothetical protein